MTAFRGWPACRVIAPAVLAAGFATAAAGITATEPEIGGPSELLSYTNGASPYTGVGRYEGRATCTAFLLDTGPIPEEAADAPAYALTSGHCPVLPGPNDVLRGAAGVGRVVFNYFADSERDQVPVPVAHTAYATMKGTSIAVLELAATYRELAGQQIKPWAPPHAGRTIDDADSIAIVGAPLWPDLAQSFLRISRCRSEGIAPVVLEHTWHFFNAPFNRCRDILAGSSGSLAISTLDDHVVGMVNTTTDGAEALSACALNHPCEPGRGGAHARPDTTYLTSIAGIGGCFDHRRRFAGPGQDCPLDPGTEPAATPGWVGPVNPLLQTQPVGPVRRAWHVTVAGTSPVYQYAFVAPPFDDCRTTDQYTAPVSTTATPFIDTPFPQVEGFVFLCISRVAHGSLDTAGVRNNPTVVVARIDTTPPRLPAQVTITETDVKWRITFATVGHEVAFHLYKTGPTATTRCSDAEGYEQVADAVIERLKDAGPYRICATPYDAAQNPGALFERVLH